MQQIRIAENKALKLGGVGTHEYQLWVDDGGSLYVRLTSNTETGTASQLLFPVAQYASKRLGTDLGPLHGLDLNGQAHEVKNNNVDGFLRAVLRHLLDGGAAK